MLTQGQQSKKEHSASSLGMLPSISSEVFHIRCTKEEGSLLIVKAQLGFVLCKSVGLVGLKTLDLVMSCFLGFHFKEYWITAFIDFPLMW